MALLFRVAEDAPLVVGANREEFYARGGEPPRLLEGPCRAVAGVDPVAQGTWLGVNQHGVLAAVTNRPKSQPPRQPRSRGLLVRALLGCRNAREASDLAAAELGSDAYAGCNVLCADGDNAYVLHSGDWLRVRPLPAGLHVMTAHDVNDASDPRLGHALGWLLERHPQRAHDAVAELQELCAQPGNGTPPMCLHGPKSGTVSSTIVVLRPALAQSTYLHSQGPPDRTPYLDYSPLLRELAIR